MSIAVSQAHRPEERRGAANETQAREQHSVRDGPDEELITLAEATRHLPKADGRKVAVCALWRWCRKGAEASWEAVPLHFSGSPGPKRLKKRAESAQAMLTASTAEIL